MKIFTGFSLFHLLLWQIYFAEWLHQSSGLDTVKTDQSNILVIPLLENDDLIIADDTYSDIDTLDTVLIYTNDSTLPNLNRHNKYLKEVDFNLNRVINYLRFQGKIL